MHVAPPSDNYFSVETYFIASAVKKYFTTCITQDGDRKEVIDYPWPVVRLPVFLVRFGEQEFRLLGGEHPCSGRLEDFFVESYGFDSMAGAPLANNDMFADESTSAAVFIAGGLAQLGCR